tara:strand:- start:13641 stop:13799 length:159 start_codon:yes stop_codon:yes gene_type:complete
MPSLLIKGKLIANVVDETKQAKLIDRLNFIQRGMLNRFIFSKVKKLNSPAKK